eukprot:2467261-Pyramimonas_sp.AAC.1
MFEALLTGCWVSWAREKASQASAADPRGRPAGCRWQPEVLGGPGPDAPKSPPEEVPQAVLTWSTARLEPG